MIGGEWKRAGGNRASYNRQEMRACKLTFAGWQPELRTQAKNPLQ
jgi:hypothetical protein